MLVSIIAVCRNASRTIARTIASVAQQTHRDIEHIIIDGASTDNTLNIINQAPYRLRCISEPDHGIYDAMNKGLSLANGEILLYLLYLNADDILAGPHVIAALHNAWMSSAKIYGCRTIVYANHINLWPALRILNQFTHIMICKKE